jgi:C1A family cysteine protease
MIQQAVHVAFRDCRTVVNILQTHVLAVSISTSGFQFYQNGMYTGKEGSSPNHGVTLIGYDPIKGYKIKNSWGLAWGNRGYAYVA